MVQLENPPESLHQHHGSQVAPVSVMSRLSTSIYNHHTKRHTKRLQIRFDIPIWIRIYHRIQSSLESMAICHRTIAVRPARNQTAKLCPEYAQKVLIHRTNTPHWSQTVCDSSVDVDVSLCVLCFFAGNRRELQGISVVLRFKRKKRYTSTELSHTVCDQ